MRRVNFIILLVIFSFILMGAQIVIVKTASNYEPLVTVIYAKTNIPEKTVITAQMLQEKKINISLNHRLAVGKANDIIGKKVKVDIEAGEMILTSRIGSTDEMENIQVLDPSKRLYTLELKGADANGGWLLTGQYVDIIYCVKSIQYNNSIVVQHPDNQPNIPTSSPSPEPSPNATSLNSLASSIDSKVTKISHIRIAAIIDDKGNLMKNTARTTLPKYVTFEVSESEVEFLAQAKENGNLSLAVIPEY